MSSPAQNFAPAGASAVRPVPGRKIDPLRSLRAHAGLAILIFAAILLAGFSLALKKGKHSYSTQAVIYISPRFLKNLDDDKEFELQSNSQYREFVQQNVRTIDRYDIVEEAVKRLGKEKHLWQRPTETIEQATLRLQGDLKILPVPDTYQIAVRLEGDQPNGLAETVNVLVSVFLEKSKEEDFYGRDQRLESLQEEAKGLRATLADEMQEKDRIAQQLAVSVFSESFSNPFDQLLVGSKEALAAATQKRIISEAQLASLKEKTTSDGTTGLQAYASEMAWKDADITTLQSNFNLRRSELLAKLDGMLPTHPERLAIEAELHTLDLSMQSKREELQRNYASILLAQREAEATSDTRAEQEIQKQVARQAAQAIWYSHNYQSGINIRYEMERARKRLEAIEDRVGFVEQEGRAPGFARLFSLARRPIVPQSGGRKKPLLILLIVAAALSLAGPLAIDFLNPRLLSPNEVEKLLGFSPIGFTCLSTASRAPHDSVDRLAAAIEREFTRNGSRSFVFAPVNLACSVAEPVADIARELEALGHVVQTIRSNNEVPLAHAAAAGGAEDAAFSRTVSAASSFGCVRDQMQSMARAGSIVLVSASPLSAAAETELLASACDVLVLALRCAQTTKKELLAATRTLDHIRPKAMAVMITDYDPDPPTPKVNLGFRYAGTARSSLTTSRAESEPIE
ncbi:MAG: hypothetical protein ABSD53_17255 [Terriglobales bacterium]|jgi:hypothetical protein